MMSNDDLVQALNDYGSACWQKKQYLAAKSAFKQALAIAPDNLIVQANLGAACHELFQFEEGQAMFEKILKECPEHPAACANYALLLNTMNEHERANQLFETAIRLEPNNTQHKWNYALNLLDMEDWQRGWEQYEIRFKNAPNDYPKYKHQLWKGEDLNGKVLCIYEEQGLGDKILFQRFIYQVKQKYPDVKLYCLLSHPLQALFWEMEKDGLCQFLPIGVIFPDDIDYGVYMMSIPGILGCNEPAHVPPDPGYIKQRCEFEKYTIKLDSMIKQGKKVGLCWHGSPNHAQDHFRSIPFEMLVPLMDNPFYSWFSLQADDYSKDIMKYGATELITDPSQAMIKHGLTRTGVIILNLDLVITVDTAVAHLAGALDIPTWLLVPRSSSWLWKRQGKTTAWYPNMTIFRQETQGNWSQVIDRVHHTLEVCQRDIESKYTCDPPQTEGSSE